MSDRLESSSAKFGMGSPYHQRPWGSAGFPPAECPVQTQRSPLMRFTGGSLLSWRARAEIESRGSRMTQSGWDGAARSRRDLRSHGGTSRNAGGTGLP